MTRSDAQNDWPRWATEPIEIVQWRPEWARQAEEEIRALEILLSPWLTAGIEHVGSTAVQGLVAKPVLDLMAGVASLDTDAEVAEVLAVNDWHFVPPDLDDRPFRRFFVKVQEGRRLAHLQIIESSNSRWSDQLTFRDSLRADESLANDYAELKRRLAAEHAEDREAYTEAKSNFIQSVLRPNDD
jgi:GrpB-like predicted nucleotidyltransferase (UPF0157 family)